jgi:hypothetical protein
MTPTELVVALDGVSHGGAGTSCFSSGLGSASKTSKITGSGADVGSFPRPSPLSKTIKQLLQDCCKWQVVLVVGEPGAGKSSFVWHHAQQTAAAGWVPVVLDLKAYTVSDLHGALPRHLHDCDLPKPSVECISRGISPPGYAGPLKLAVFCDGFDELQSDSGKEAHKGMRDIVSTLCGGASWPQSVLRVVITTRGNAVLDTLVEARVFDSASPDGPKHVRRIILPFNNAKVCCSSCYVCLLF